MTTDNQSTPQTDGATDAAGAGPDTPDLATGLLDAIDKSLQEEGAPAPAQTTGGDKGEPTAGAEDDGQEVAEQEAGDGEGASADEGDKGKEKGASKQDEEEAGDAGKAAGGKGGSEAGQDDKGKAGAAAPDPVNDPIPTNLKKATRERMEALVSKVKATSAEAQNTKKDRDDLVGMVVDTGASPEQFNGVLNYLRLANSQSAEERKQALTLMRQDVERLAAELGEAVPGVDVLAKFPDLQQAVEEGELTEAHANELAQARQQREMTTARQKAADSQRQNQTQLQAAVQQGRTELNALEIELQATDPDYARKREILVPTLQALFAQLPPQQWAATFRKACQELKLPAAPARKSIAQNQPLRPGQPAGQSQKQASSMAEAIEMSLEEGGRR